MAASLTTFACVSATDAPDEESSASVAVEEGTVAPQSPVRERWCNSYKSAAYCPKNVCVWFKSPAPGRCGLPLSQ